MTLPIDRTNLIAAQTNQVPNSLIRSALNIAAMQTPYDTIDELYDYVQTFAGPGAIGTINLANLSVTTAKLALLAVTAAQIANSTITETQLANGAVTSAKILDGTITTADLADTIISTAKLIDDSVTSAKISSLAITLSKMAAASVGTTQLVDLSVTNEKIANGALTASKFYPGTLNNETANSLRISALEYNPTLNSTTATESAPLGPELTDATGWTSTGWTGNYATGFINTVGNVSPLSRTMTATGTKLYLIEFTVTSPTPAGEPNASTDFVVSIGNSVSFVTYKGGGNFNYSFGIRSVSNGDLVVTPGVTFDGTLTNISVKEITGAALPSLKMQDSTTYNSLEMRPTKALLNNTFIGVNAGSYNIKGDGNVAVGKDAMKNNTSGYWDIAFGEMALASNTTGSRNVAIGRLSLNGNISGDRNIAIGTYALIGNTTGRQNIALGADTLWQNTSGFANVALGTASMSNNTVGNYNIAIGLNALDSAVNASDNVAIGNQALKNVTSEFNVAIGKWALRNSTSGSNTAVGYQALNKATTANSNTAVGGNALAGITTGDYNVFMGTSAGLGVNGNFSVNRNVAIGVNAGWGLNTGADNNVFLGFEAGKATTTGAKNILIGYQVDAPSATTSNSLNIGNSVFGDTLNHRMSIGLALTDTNTSYTQLQVGSSAKAGAIDVRRGATANGTEMGLFRFWNESNLDAGAGTRKYIAQINSLMVTGNSNVNGDSGGDMLFHTKSQGGGSLAERMRIKDNGRIGIGVSAPTAYLHLPAGSAGLNGSPLKLTSGTLQTTAEAGSLEFDGTNLYFSPSNGNRKQVAFV